MISEKDLPRLQRRARIILNKLRKLFPRAKIALTYGSPWELLVAVQLSAQCTDKKVNEVTPALFKKYGAVKNGAGGRVGSEIDAYVKAGRTAAGIRAFENAIHACGFYRAKTRNILAAARYIKEHYAGTLPRTMAEMVKVPGVGRKSANVILGNAYGVVEGIAVDTHVMRLSRVLGLSRERTPEKIEQDLMAIIPRKDWFTATYLIIDYGRAYCVARPHKHELCPLTAVLERMDR